MKFVSIFFLFFLMFFSIKSNGQDTTILKRTPYTLKINVDKENFFEDKIGATPYLFPNNGMQIYPGETIYVEVDQENGIIKSMKAIKEIKNPKTTLTIKFYQESENNVHQVMMLEIHNPFPKDLTYGAKMFLLKTRKWADTDVYPVVAGLSAFESWSDIVISLGLGNWKFKDKQKVYIDHTWFGNMRDDEYIPDSMFAIRPPVLPKYESLVLKNKLLFMSL